jgi:hypothetical protein
MFAVTPLYEKFHYADYHPNMCKDQGTMFQKHVYFCTGANTLLSDVSFRI